MTRVLFICKRRLIPYGCGGYGQTFGLINSARFIADGLARIGIEAKAVTVDDANGIDRVVYEYKPTHVFIHALWVTPEKLRVLLPRYRTARWNVRVHSQLPFLANEGIAIEWLAQYLNDIAVRHPNLSVSCNTERTARELSNIFHATVNYLPNLYFPPATDRERPAKPDDGIDIGCFGAIRPMKNHLLQAVAAIRFGDSHGVRVRFHINTSRQEQGGERVLKNLRALFAWSDHELVEHDWMEHGRFLALVRRMDVGMQVSLSESYNIVTADFVHSNVPVVVSPEVSWVPPLFWAHPNSSADIVRALRFALFAGRLGLHRLNNLALAWHNSRALRLWKRYLENGCAT